MISFSSLPFRGVAAVAAASVMTAVSANAAILAPLDSGVVALNGDTAVTNDGSVTTGVGDTFAVRERVALTQTNRRINTFLTFDISGFTAADVAQPGFSATYSIDVTEKLNSLNSASISVGSFDSALLDSGTGTFPGFIEPALTTDSVVLTDSLGDTDIAAFAVLDATTQTGSGIVALAADISNIVSDAVLAGETELGLVTFITQNRAQAAGFGSAEVEIVVPEPGSIALCGAGVVMCLIRRRRN